MKVLSQTVAKRITREQGLPKSVEVTHACGCKAVYQTSALISQGVTAEQQAARRCWSHR